MGSTRRPPGGGDEADLVALGRRVAGGGQRLVLCFLRAEQREEAVNFLAHVNTSGVGRLFLGVALDGPAASLLKARRRGAPARARSPRRASAGCGAVALPGRAHGRRHRCVGERRARAMEAPPAERGAGGGAQRRPATARTSSV